MPKKNRFTVQWSPEKEIYELYDRAGGKTISLSENDLHWLEQRESFSFEGKKGRLTLRKETKTRGGSYWYAYRRAGRRLLKRYLGTPAGLTLEILEEAANRLSLPDPVGEAQQAQLELKSPQPAGILLVGKEEAPPGALALSPALSLPVLTPKLRIPRLHSNLVVRDRLLVRLDTGFERKLTLVSAPAGFGKTTLVSQWIAERSVVQPFPVAWVSLDEGDNDPVRFWRYVLTACQSIHPNFRESSLAGLLNSSSPGKPAWQGNLAPLPEEELLAALINELSQVPTRGVLVLEDYHLIVSPQIQAAVAKLVEHLPASIHLILITRNDPPLPLARLRARDELLEINASELTFSTVEARDFLQQALPFPLSAEELDRLEARTEGWGAGMRLLALALQRQGVQSEIERTLATFTGSHYHLLEYFTGEVLAVQTKPIQDFLLKTSLLERLTGPLCDALTGENNAEQLLAELERAGLFLIPLDDAGQWYRYHALFAEALRHEARFRLGEETLSGCYLRASHWYEENGMLPEAVETALSAGDFSRATTLIERFAEMPQFNERHELYTLQRWLEQLPEKVLRTSPALSFLFSNALVFLSLSDQLSSEILAQVEKALGWAEEGWRSAGYRPGQGEVFAFRSLLAYRQGDVYRAASLARQALPWLPGVLNFAPSRVICLSIIGEEERLAGLFDPAREKVLEALRLCEASGNLAGKRVMLYDLGQIALTKGDLRQAAGYFRQVLAQTGEDVADREKTLIGMAWLDYEWNELEKASAEAREALDLATQFPDELLRARAIIVLAKIFKARREFSQAQEMLEELLGRVGAAHQASLIQEVERFRIDLQLAVGDTGTARGWVTKTTENHESPPKLVQEQEDLLTARAWIGLKEPGRAEAVLDPLLDFARGSGHTALTIEILLLKTLVFAASKRTQPAKEALREALTLAYPDRYQRLFLDQGPAIQNMLKALLPEITEKHLAEYARILLNAFRQEGEKDLRLPATNELVEPLSSQELRILRLLEAGLSRQEIAQELLISVNTVKTHLQHIFQKLNVTNRAEAIEVARKHHPR